MPKRKPGQHKPINLALQGGGAHGAFTWGVIDKLLEDGRLTFDAVSGTSAGAMNAVVMIDGFDRGGNDGARERLQEFWMRVSHGGGKVEPGHEVIDEIIGFWRSSMQPFAYFPRLAAVASPYRFNPLNINPLRDLLESLRRLRPRAVTARRHGCSSLRPMCGPGRSRSSPARKSPPTR